MDAQSKHKKGSVVMDVTKEDIQKFVAAVLILAGWVLWPKDKI